MSVAERELRTLRAAIVFFTRIRVPGSVSSEDLAGVLRYFPLVGLLVGGFGATVWWAARQLLPTDIAIVLSIAATVLVTGAFHEDGFADVCDGFGGGFDRARVLAIMKDSRVGAFGAIGVTLLLGLKAIALIHVPMAAMIATVVTGHAASRWMAGTLVMTHEYVRDEAGSKSKPMATRLTLPHLLVATVFGAVPVLLLLPIKLWWGLVLMAATRWLLGRWFRQRIGGYTGDCLGAMQQVCEVVFYLTVVSLTCR